MAWNVGKIQIIDTGLNGFSGPGFVLQRDGHSPSLMMVLRDERSAKANREAFLSIVDSAAVIVGS